MFHDIDRASNFRKLQLCGDVDPGLLMAIFENCTKLDKITIHGSSTLQDYHLIEWVRRGGGSNLRKIQLYECENISDDGLIPIILTGGECLVNFRMDMFDNPRITCRTWRVLIDHCPFLKVAALPEVMKPLAREECILSKVSWMNDVPSVL